MLSDCGLTWILVARRAPDALNVPCTSRRELRATVAPVGEITVEPSVTTCSAPTTKSDADVNVVTMPLSCALSFAAKLGEPTACTIGAINAPLAANVLPRTRTVMPLASEAGGVDVL